jgi:uncharacterized membrane protein (UPF0127 family)
MLADSWLALRAVSYAIAGRVARKRWRDRLAGFLVAAPVLVASTQPQVRIHTTSGQAIAIDVEIAATSKQRERGLMFRQELAPRQGMLFVFRSDADHSFWMKNTPLSLDLIFIDASLRVVAIQANAVPHSLQQLRGGRPSRYVLEVPAGLCAREGVRVGDRVELSGIDLEAVTRGPPSRPRWVASRGAQHCLAFSGTANL